jgi:hypothetical protein
MVVSVEGHGNVRHEEMAFLLEELNTRGGHSSCKCCEFWLRDPVNRALVRFSGSNQWRLGANAGERDKDCRVLRIEEID